MRSILFIAFTISASAEPATIRVFVALADNASQGILPVPAAIGNGDDAQRNLYWGCSDALKPVFKKSADWKLQRAESNPNPNVLERVVFVHSSGKWQIVADGYRGKAIKQCTMDFFAALASAEPAEKVPIVAYIGHNGLMDFEIPESATARKGGGREAVVLCCKSREYFEGPLAKVRAKPLLLTNQLMYPGAFILSATLDGWMAGESGERIRARAALAYSKHQKISVKSAGGVFYVIE